jgi:hypothetical protein
VFHVAYVVATDVHSIQLLRELGIAPYALARGVEILLPYARPTVTKNRFDARDARPPRTSQDLKTLVDRTRQLARRRGRNIATLSDYVVTLVADSNDLDCSRKLRDLLTLVRHSSVERQPAENAPRRPEHLFGYDRATLRQHSHLLERDRSDAAHHSEAALHAVSLNDTPVGSASGGLTSLNDRLGHPNHSTTQTSPGGINNEADARLEKLERLIAGLTEQLAHRDAAALRMSVPRPKAARRAAVVRADNVLPASTELRDTPAELRDTNIPAQPSGSLVAAAGVSQVASGSMSRGAAHETLHGTMNQGLSRHLRKGRRLPWGSTRNASPTIAGDGRSLPTTTALVRIERPLLSLVPSKRSNIAPTSTEDDDDVSVEENFDAWQDDADGVNERGERIKRFYLTLDDEIVRAPSIGPRTAARLIPHGIEWVRHLLSCNSQDLAIKVGARHITPQKIRNWQDQARLVCIVPWLRGTHAQLLVGAEFSTVERILRTDPALVCAGVFAYAATRDGQSVLRAGPPPDEARVRSWISHAGMAEPERATLSSIAPIKVPAV